MIPSRSSRPAFRTLAGLCILVPGLLPLVAAGNTPPESPLTHSTIGVLAYRGESHAFHKWLPTVDYLNAELPHARFRLQAMTLPEMRNAVAGQSVDFILTNPGNYVQLEADYGVSRILTLQSAGPRRSNRIGSAILARADRDDIRNIKSLPGRSFMAVSRDAFGGYQVALRELDAHGIDPVRDFPRLDFVGFPQDAIVYAVRDGRIDLGVVRACLLEHMIDEGHIEAGVLRVIDPIPHENFDCKASTRLYPGWPLAKLRHTPEALAKQVARALLALPPDSKAARAGNHGGFTIPMDYQPVHELFQDLKIRPYQGIGHTSLQQLWDRYWQWAVFLMFALLWGVWHIARVEHMVAVRTDQLSTANEKLRQEMEERRKAERQALLRQAELAHVSRISAVGELASGMAHELNQPLSAINSYAQGTAWRLQSGETDTAELIDIHQQIAAQAERAGTIIQRFRDFLRKEDVVCTEVDVNRAIEDALQLFAGEVRRYELDIQLQLAAKLPPICAEQIQVEQVILNLLRNAAEAMQTMNDREHRLVIRSEEHADRVWMCVSDNGPGMPEEVAAHLFEPFYTTKPDGMGLGLSISRSIIEAQGGKLELEKNDTSGVTLTISWPPYRGEPINES